VASQPGGTTSTDGDEELIEPQVQVTFGVLRDAFVASVSTNHGRQRQLDSRLAVLTKSKIHILRALMRQDALRGNGTK
jgi:hypothetical protein